MFRLLITCKWSAYDTTIYGGVSCCSSDILVRTRCCASSIHRCSSMICTFFLFVSISGNGCDLGLMGVDTFVTSIYAMPYLVWNSHVDTFIT